MITASDLKGMMAMMPSFATDNAIDVTATETIDVARLHQGLDRMIGDGADVIATTGSFGECHTLLMDEFRVLAHETVAATKARVPLFIGVTSPNTREAIRKMKIVAETGADGVLVGVPYYFPSSVENALRFYTEIAELFPKLAIMVYHNPVLHKVTLVPDAIAELVKIPSVVAMKDSHRTPDEMNVLAPITRGKMSLFVFHTQYAEYARLGAAGFWSIDSWMGPWPHLALRDAVAQGDWERARAVTADLTPPATGAAPDMRWRENASKVAVAAAGYVNPGPLRPPFLTIPEEVQVRSAARAQRWQGLCEKYRTSELATT